MEEDKLKDIFSGYDPQLSSSSAFMESLERSLNAIEFIHKENAAVMKRNRKAVTFASIAGFITGAMFTLMFPYIDSLVHALINGIFSAARLSGGFYGIQVVTWLLIGGASVFVALNTYSLALGVRAWQGARRGG